MTTSRALPQSRWPGCYVGLRIKGTRLAEERILFLGAGEAATGIADLSVSAMVADGTAIDEARKRCWLVDSKGLVVKGRTGLVEHSATTRDHAPVSGFIDAIRAIGPTAIIGVAAVGGSFNAEVLAEMARMNTHLIVFALSNPTSKSGVHRRAGL